MSFLNDEALFLTAKMLRQTVQKNSFLYLLVLKVSDTVYLDALLNFRVNSILFIIHYKLHLASMTLKLMGVGKWHAKYCNDRLSMSLQRVQLSV